VIEAVVFDMDGVLVESEHLWDEVRRDVAARHGGRWRDDATRAMQGMSSPEWAAYLRDAVGVDLPADRINDLVVGGLLARYAEQLPLLPGAVEAVRRLGAHWPLAVASSSNRVLIDAALAAAGIADAFAATVSSEEVARGKPAPDVYLEAVRRLGRRPGACAAVEDSTNGLRSARAAGLHVVAVPNRDYPPAADAVADAAVVLARLDELTVEVVAALGAGAAGPSPGR
jgi:HAD superfamily hydrolase (TIGR01509 family)